MTSSMVLLLRRGSPFMAVNWNNCMVQLKSESISHTHLLYGFYVQCEKFMLYALSIVLLFTCAHVKNGGHCL